MTANNNESVLPRVSMSDDYLLGLYHLAKFHDMDTYHDLFHKDVSTSTQCHDISSEEEIHPSLNFSYEKTLRDVNYELKKENEELKRKGMFSQNQKFLLNVKLSNFKVSQNLDGKLKDQEIIVYPANQKIKKDIDYKIQYKSNEDGLIYIEGFYKNKKNAKSIEVSVDNEEYSIVDFYGGRYFFFDGEMNISIKYTQNYDHLSWQKAGILRVKKVT